MWVELTTAGSSMQRALDWRCGYRRNAAGTQAVARRGRLHTHGRNPRNELPSHEGRLLLPGREVAGPDVVAER